MTLTETARVSILQAILDGLGSPMIRLSKTNPAVTEAEAVITDFTEADFEGYAAKDLSAFAAASLNGADQGQTDSSVLTWTRTSTGTAQTLYWLYITWDPLGEGDELLACHKFAASGTLVNADEEVNKQISLYCDNLSL